MKLAAFCAALLVSIPVMSAEPFIIGSIINRAGGQITFTTRAENCESGQRRGFTRDDGGKIDHWFCWMLFGEEFIVAYDDGERWAYTLGALILSDEYRAYMQRKGGAL